MPVPVPVTCARYVTHGNAKMKCSDARAVRKGSSNNYGSRTCVALIHAKTCSRGPGDLKMLKNYPYIDLDEIPVRC